MDVASHTARPTVKRLAAEALFANFLCMNRQTKAFASFPANLMWMINVYFFSS